MITTIILRHFQSHGHTQLPLHPGVNTIIGPSDSGKTAILRGLYWVAYNRPLGEAYVSHWNRRKKSGAIKDITSVTVTLGTGGQVARQRSSDFNGYTVSSPDEEQEQRLEAVRAEVPEQVRSALDLTDVNIQRQMDAPFLLSESPAEVARFFNRSMRLDLIDRLLSEIEGTRRRLIRQDKQTQERAGVLEAEIERYNWIEEAQRLYDQVSDRSQRLQAAEHLHRTLHTMTEEYDQETILARHLQARLGRWEKKAIRAQTFIESVGEAEEIKLRLQRSLKSHIEARAQVKAIGDVRRIEASHEKAVRRVTRIEKASSVAKRLEAGLQEHHRVSAILQAVRALPQIEPMMVRAQEAAAGIEQSRRTRTALAGSYEEHTRLRTALTKALAGIEDLERQMPDTCPLCGGPMKRDHTHDRSV